MEDTDKVEQSVNKAAGVGKEDLESMQKHESSLCIEQLHQERLVKTEKTRKESVNLSNQKKKELSSINTKYTSA